jgi:hypothetical protein
VPVLEMFSVFLHPPPPRMHHKLKKKKKKERKYDINVMALYCLGLERYLQIIILEY